LKAPGSERLKLQYDEQPSNFSFKFNLRRYNLWRLDLKSWVWEKVKKQGMAPGRG